MKWGFILLVLLLVPMAFAQLSVYHPLNQISADGGVTSIDPDDDGKINATNIENGDAWIVDGQTLYPKDNATIIMGDMENAPGTAKFMINLSDNTGFPMLLIGDYLRKPGMGNDDNSTYLFIKDLTGGKSWGLQAQDDGDFGIHEAGRTTPFLIKKDTGKIGINLTNRRTTDPQSALEVEGTVTATAFSGDGSQLTGMTGISAGHSSCYYTAASGTYWVTSSCPAGYIAVSGSNICTGTTTQGCVPTGGNPPTGWRCHCANGWSSTTYTMCCQN